jgi:putative transposase
MSKTTAHQSRLLAPRSEIAMQAIAGWFEDYNENHPHSGLKMRSPREVRFAQIAIA